jgi:uncharacterized protein involved in exopolysaccharide biosynthesis
MLNWFHHFEQQKSWRAYGRDTMLIVGGSILLSGLVAVTLPRSYTAEVSLLVKLGREKFSGLQMTSEPMNVLFQEREQNLNNEAELLKSNRLLMEVVRSGAMTSAAGRKAEAPEDDTLLGRIRDFASRLKTGASELVGSISAGARDILVKLGVSERLTPEQGFALLLRSNLGVVPLKQTDVIFVSLTWDDPQVAADLLNNLIDRYLEMRLDVYGTGQSVNFFSKQLATTERDLAEAERQFTALTRSSGLNDPDAERTLLLNTLSGLRAELRINDLERRTTQRLKADLSVAYNSPAPWVQTPQSSGEMAATRALDEKFVQLLAERVRLSSLFSDDSADIRRINGQLTQLRRQKYETLDSLYEARVQELATRRLSLEREITARRDELLELSKMKLQFDDLSRKRERLQARVNEYAAKIERTRVNQDLDEQVLASVSPVSRAIPPFLPSAPKKWLIVGLGALIGLLLAAARVAWLEYVSKNRLRLGSSNAPVFPTTRPTASGAPMKANVP